MQSLVTELALSSFILHATARQRELWGLSLANDESENDMISPYLPHGGFPVVVRTTFSSVPALLNSPNPATLSLHYIPRQSAN